ncbi:MAG: S-methyl-5-thioribose-1-phosphate isomerase [Candidatus Omnitrophota bacterium]
MQSVKWEKGSVVLIDQTELPEKLEFLKCKDVKTLQQAIRFLKVRGAPAIGAAAALGLVLGVYQKKFSSSLALRKRIDKLYAYLAASRPTAVNLIWGLKRIRDVVIDNQELSIAQIQKVMLKEAQSIIQEDKISCRKMADYAQALVKKNDRILTYCNTGMLATVGYGTAAGVLYRAKELKKKIKVYACETRPLLQGARLTCWELSKNKVDVTLICDNMAGYLMQQKKIDRVFIGADRIAANGDTANKIGSYSIAVLANFHKIPFYVVAPRSTFDLNLKQGNQIPIEERSEKEVKEMFFKKPIALPCVDVYNPAFDVVPNKLITAIVTDTGIIRAPFKKNISSIFDN